MRKIGMKSSSGEKNGDKLEPRDEEYIETTLVPVGNTNRD
jgi:hypothetical protein